MTQSSSTLSKSLAEENRTRDIRRRVEVIHKKLADLQNLGIPCAFCYSSTRITGSIFTLGDTRITDVIERHKNEIHKNLMEEQSELLDGHFSKEIHLILPPIPAPLEELGRSTLQSFVIGIMKDLGLRWSDPKPDWWPLDVPFVHPRLVPENFTGNWVAALRKVLESVYSYFSYDVNTYISSQLESPKPDLHGEAVIRSSTNSVSKRREHPQAQMSRDSDNDRDRDTPITSTYEDNSSCNSSSNNIQKRPPNKLVSNFTVENILMGPQHSSSSSSHSPSSAGSSLASPTTSLDYTSVMGGNWISHPPVKYTKFTMLSPVSMGEETQKKKKVRTEPPMTESPTPRRHSSSNDLSLSSNLVTEKHRIGMKRVPSNPTVTEKHNLGIKRVPSNPTVTPTLSQIHSFYSSSPSHSALSPEATVSKSTSTEVGSIPQSKAYQFPVQTMRTKSVSTLPVIQAVPYPSTGVKANLQQTFPPSQQFVLLVPSTSTRVSEGLQAVVYSNPTQVVPLNSSSDESVENVRAPSSTTRNHISGHISDSRTATESSIVSPSQTTTNDLEKLPVEVSYRPIAPKTKSIFSRESLSTTPTDKPSEKRNKRSLPKPQKLRFHMTTVVKRPKRTMVTSSMTVKSPSSIVSERTRTTSFVLHSQPCADVLAETNIMKSKNDYSNDKQSEDLEERMNESEDSESTLTDSPRASVDLNENKDFRKSTLSQDQPIALKDSGFHIQTLQNADSSENHMVSHFHDENHTSAGASRDNGRTTRSYTRRKRELTFHRYEDPETAFKVKRAAKE